MYHSNDILLRLFFNLLNMSLNSLTYDLGSNMTNLSLLADKIVLFAQTERIKMLSLCIKS